MRESRRPHPAPRGSESRAAAAGGAIARLLGIPLVPLLQIGIVADAALIVEPLVAVGVETLVLPLRIEAQRQVALAVDPDLMAGGVLAERGIQALLRRIAALRVPRIGALLEYAEGRDIGWEGIFWKQALVEQPIEQFAAVDDAMIIIAAVFDRLIFDIVTAGRIRWRRGCLDVLFGHCEMLLQDLGDLEQQLIGIERQTGCGEQPLQIGAEIDMLVGNPLLQTGQREDILRTAHEVSDAAERRKYVRTAADGVDPILLKAADQIGEGLAAGDDGIVEVENWIGCGPSDDGCWIAEKALVVAVGAAEHDDSGKPGAAPAGTTRALLIVGSARRHVSERHRSQAADVDANLHRGRATQNVDRRADLPILLNRDILEAKLVGFVARHRI